MAVLCFDSGPDLTGGPEQLRHPVRNPPDGGFPVKRTAGCALQRVDSGKVCQRSVLLHLPHCTEYIPVEPIYDLQKKLTNKWKENKQVLKTKKIHLFRK